LHFGECGDAARPAVGIAGLFVEIEHEKGRRCRIDPYILKNRQRRHFHLAPLFIDALGSSHTVRHQC
jgi:hypothetical protein